MTKRKTALQSAIDEIQEVLNSRGANESNCDDYELGLIQSVKILKSKLPQEKQDLIMSHYFGLLAVLIVLILASLIELNKI